MNRVFRLVWNEYSQSWGVASEHAKGKTKSGVRNRRRGALISLVCVLNTCLLQPALAATGTVGSGETVMGEVLENFNQSVQGGGVASDTSINSGGFQQVLGGGLATGTTINAGGVQNVLSAGGVTGTTVNSSGLLNVFAGGSALGVVQVDGGRLVTNTDASVGGVNILGAFGIDSTTHVANNVLLENGGQLDVLSGGTANGTTVNSAGNLIVQDGGSTFNTKINSGGRQTISSGAVADGTITNQAGMQVVFDGGVAVHSIINSGGQLFISSGGSADMTFINTGGVQIVRSGGAASNTSIFGYGTQNIDAGGYSTNISLSGLHAGQDVYGVAHITTLDAGSTQRVYGSGFTSDVLVHSGSEESIFSGAANNVQIDDGGKLTVAAGASATVVSQSAGAILDTNTNATLRGNNALGIFFIDSASHSASNVVLENGGHLDVLSGGTASDTTVSSNSLMEVHDGAVALNTVVNLDGLLFLDTAGVGNNTMLNSGAELIAGGISNNTTVNSGAIQQMYDGLINSAVINSGGEQQLLGGFSQDSTVNLGGNQFVFDTASAIGTKVVGGHQLVSSGGVALGTILSAAGAQFVSDGGVADSTVISSGGQQLLSSGGHGSNTKITAAGEQFVLDGGTASSTIVHSAGTQFVLAGGLASSTTVDTFGVVNVAAGGVASSVLQNAGGALVTNTDATVDGISDRGSFFVHAATLSASNVLLENGGRLDVNSNGMATDTIAADLGKIVVASGGVLNGTTQIKGTGELQGDVINNGNLIFDQSRDTVFGGALSGSGSLTKDGINQLTLAGPLSYTGDTFVNAGTLALDGTNMTGNVIGVSGSLLHLQNGAGFTGMIDPLNVSLDQGTTWTMTANSLVDTLTVGGAIDILPNIGEFSAKTLTVKNLVGDNGVVTLNTVLGGSNASDKIVVDGGSASGHTGLMIRNAGGLGDMTAGAGIQVVQAINGATTETHAFALKAPVLAGAYEYNLRKGNETAAGESWYLTTDLPDTGAGDAGNEGVGGTGGDESTPDYRAETSLYSILPSQALEYGNTLISTLHERRGANASDMNVADQPTWFHAVTVHREHDAASKGIYGNGAGFDAHISALQVGTDLYRHEDSQTSDRAGLYGAVGHSKASVDHFDGAKSGNNDLDAYTIGAYWTHIEQPGWYVDAVLQSTWNKLSASSVNGQSLESNGLGNAASVEIGYPIKFAGGIVVEPQAQVIHQHINLGNSHDDAANVRFDDVDSTQARLGVRVAKKWSKAGKSTLTAWVRPSVVQEFQGNPETTFSSEAHDTPGFNSDLRGTTFKFDAGVEGAVNEAVSLSTKIGYDTVISGKTSGHGASAEIGISIHF